jgi:hypothetical protein
VCNVYIKPNQIFHRILEFEKKMLKSKLQDLEIWIIELKLTFKEPFFLKEFLSGTKGSLHKEELAHLVLKLQTESLPY